MTTLLAEEIIIPTIPTIPTGPITWPQIDPQYVLALLHKLNVEKCPNKKLFSKTYKVYANLNEEQINKTVKFVTLLDPPVREAIFSKATTDYYAFRNQSNSVSEKTNKFDRQRLLHVYADPRGRREFEIAFTPLTREFLDENENQTKAAYGSGTSADDDSWIDDPNYTSANVVINRTRNNNNTSDNE